MTQGKAMCYDEHICDKCRTLTHCGTYTWACPWRNDDEYAMCSSCEDAFAAEYQAFVDGEQA